MLYQHIRDGSSGPYQIYVRDETEQMNRMGSCRDCVKTAFLKFSTIRNRDLVPTLTQLGSD